MVARYKVKTLELGVISNDENSAELNDHWCTAGLREKGCQDMIAIVRKAKLSNPIDPPKILASTRQTYNPAKYQSGINLFALSCLNCGLKRE